MSIIDLAVFYEKHKNDLAALIPSGKGDPSLLTDLAAALAPVVKKHFPQYNPNNLIDDALTLLRVEVGPASPPTLTPQEH